ncbi:MAG TPA: hypothetical protein VI318_21690 [Baekduia sp.]
MRRATVIAFTIGCALAGCGGGAGARHGAPATTAYAAHGLAVRLPSGWQAARVNLTPHLVDPREELAVATFPLRYRPTACAHMPGSALADLGPRDAFVTLMERGSDHSTAFPPRPADFAAAEGDAGRSEASACVPGARFVDHWFEFSDGGRDFHVLVAFGPSATAATRRAAWRILDGLRVDASVRPTWPRSP